MSKVTYFKNKVTGEFKTLKSQEVGNHDTFKMSDFNTDVFWLGPIYLFFKQGDIKNGVILFLLIALPLSILNMMGGLALQNSPYSSLVSANMSLISILYALFVLCVFSNGYNKERTKELIEQGYEIVEPK